jgi:Flp pilus assembly protein TadG
MNLFRQPIVQKEDGQALIEFALVSSLFIFLFVGIVDYAIYIHMQIELNEAASTAAAFGAAPDNQTNISLMSEAGAYDAGDIRNLTVNATTFYTCTQGGSQVTQTTICGGTYDNRPLQYVQVTTSAPVPATLRWTGIATVLNLQGQATYRVRWYQ